MAENIENNGCSQRDNAEHEGYVKASRPADVSDFLFPIIASCSLPCPQTCQVTDGNQYCFVRPNWKL